ncbi:sulfur carrier protein ThiS [Halocynthiibacter sp. C4]|uniref:sulfur carrier protein ThiS n=1 Tax=Halocynthiibacter sp. C4 TaxID=2992758 RepID=UPI00237A8097|nr:sulfur carrier protein ThiS [Halocynthiibacter sp. C4]MDE0590592.1 sulfur carrier protein ThiS [Halocynthiibacter sp. C4]
MTILINGEATPFDGATLADALNANGYADTVVATAVNGTFVPAEARSDFAIKAGDQIEVLAPMQGG